MATVTPPSVFVVDPEHKVHTRWCPVVKDEPYQAYFTKPKTALDLLEHLSRPDRKDGHDAPGILSACDTCIHVQADTERTQISE